MPIHLRDIRILAALLSVLLSAWCFFLDPVVNNDGVRYLGAADLFLRGEWEAGLGVFRWPFYSMAIAGTSALTGLGVELAAQCLNAALFAVIVVAFISLLKECGAKRAVVNTAALVILIYATLNEYRSFVTRDPGYIAFYLLSLLLFVQYFKNPRLRTAFAWCAMTVCAALFRVEGLTWLLLMPPALLLDAERPWATRLTTFLRANIAPAILLIGTALLFLANQRFQWIAALDRVPLHEPFVRLGLFFDAIGDFPEKAALLSGTIIDARSSDHAPMILLLGLLYILAAETIKTVTPLYLTLSVHALCKRLLFPENFLLRPWCWLLAVHLVSLAVYVVPNFLLAGRYPLAFSLTLLLAVPFSIVRLYEARRERFPLWRRAVFPVVVGFLAFGAIDGLVSFGGSKNHLKAAGEWIGEEINANERLATNCVIVKFYTGLEFRPEDRNSRWEETKTRLTSDEWSDHDMLAVRLRRREKDRVAELEDLVGQAPARIFKDRRGDQVVIFRRPEPGQ